MAVIINGNTLENARVSMRPEYYRTRSLEIIGGSISYTVTGNVSVGDDAAGSLTGSQVMEKLKAIREIGKQTGCVTVVLEDFYSGLARITNINIEQGSDPSWVNQGAYTIELKSKIDAIPPNSLGITAEDCVTDFDQSEDIELGEDSHSYIYNGGEFSKTFVRFNNKINITCQPICPDSGQPFNKSMEVLRRLVKFGPQHEIFDEYKTWTRLLQTRNIDTNSDGSVTFTASIILVPPCATNKYALVDLIFAHNKNYRDKTEKRSINGNITGLVSLSWSDIITLPDTCIDSKLSAADTVLEIIKTRFSNLGNWEGAELSLIKQPNCPSNPITACQDTTDLNSLCVKPSMATVSKSRVEGTISFNFEWSTVDGCEQNGFKVDLNVDINYREPIVAEHIIPMYGTLLQDLKTFRPLKYEFTASLSGDSGSCAILDPCILNDLENQLLELIEQYIGPATATVNLQGGGDGTGFIIVNNSKSRTLSSLTLKRDYLQQCEV